MAMHAFFRAPIVATLLAAALGLPALSALGSRPEDLPLAAAPADLGDPIPGLTLAEEDLAVRGRRLFRWELWQPNGPVNGINARECSLCHLEPYYGGGSIDPVNRVAFVPDDAELSGFRTVHRLQRQANSRRFAPTPPPEGAQMRRAPSLFGLGLMEAIPEASLLAQVDPDDKNGDGISGRLLMVEGKAGRFGWKGHVASIERFVLDAFRTEMGMTVEPFERDDFGPGLSLGQVKAVTHYVKTLGPPPTPKKTKEFLAGRALFERIGCAACHTPSQKTGASPLKPLNLKTIETYSDMLLHEMGDAPPHVAAGRPSPTEFRTPALWGIGAFPGPFWHDGSAPTIDSAILLHAGEGRASKEKFEKLSAADRATVLKFLSQL